MTDLSTNSEIHINIQQEYDTVHKVDLNLVLQQELTPKQKLANCFNKVLGFIMPKNKYPGIAFIVIIFIISQ